MVAQTKVFVGSLPQGSKPEELRKLFERFGAVTECDIMNRCGFVHMQTEDQAAASAVHGAPHTTAHPTTTATAALSPFLYPSFFYSYYAAIE